METVNKDVEILLIEDNHEEAQLVIRSLRKSNLMNHLLHIDDGEEAMDFIYCRGKYALRSNGNQPNLILLDLHLPKVSGIEILKLLKSEASTRRIPVVVLTSSKEEQDIIRSYDLGANSYIVKPVNFESFTEAVRSLGMYWLLMNEKPIHTPLGD